MKVLSLFSGVGGFDLGLEAAGMETVFQCEWDKHATKILERHWPNVPRWGDVSTLTAAHILSVAPVVDVVAWGSPCQDLSVAGKRAGLGGERSGLFHQGIRIIKEMRKITNGKYPRMSIWENVAGALSSGGGADFGEVLYEMDEAGACFSEWRMLDAQYFGVPQRRRRVFVVSVFDPGTAERCPDPLLPVEEGVRGDSAEGATTREGVAGAVAAGVGSGGEVAGSLTWRMKNGYNGQDAYSNLLQVVENDEHQSVVGSLAARDYKGVGNQYVQEGKVVVQPIVFENSYRDSARIAEDGVTQTLSAKMGTGGGNTPMVAIPIQDGREIESNQNGLGVAESGAPAYTLTQIGAQSVAVAYSFDSLASNSMKSSNPHSGVREVTVSKTLDTTHSDPSCNQGGIAIVEPIGIQGNVIGRQDHNGPAGKGHTEEGDPMFTLNTTDRHAVATPIGFSHTQGLSAPPSEEAFPTLRREGSGMAVAFDEYNQRIYEPHIIAPTLTAANDPSRSPQASEVTQQVAAVAESTMTVRRLTPLECERLMGWPDNWTAGQSDTHRYKQCGNGVASPVAQWIGQQLINL